MSKQASLLTRNVNRPTHEQILKLGSYLTANREPLLAEWGKTSYPALAARFTTALGFTVTPSTLASCAEHLGFPAKRRAAVEPNQRQADHLAALTKVVNRLCREYSIDAPELEPFAEPTAV